MTRFQRRMMAIVTYAISDELENRSKGVKILQRYVKVYSGDGSYLMDVKIRQISWQAIELEDMYSHFKFYSEIISNYIRFKSEDQEYDQIELEDLSPSYMQGKDGKGYRFRASKEGYKKMKISDDEHGKDFVYLLEW